MSITIGIDPGLSGAIAGIDTHGHSQVADLPVQRDKSLAWIDGKALKAIILGYCNGLPHQATCIIERVSAMPKQGVSSSFGFGVNFGSVLGVLQALEVRIELVTPAKWKRDLGLTAEKHASLHKARLLFPKSELHLCKHDGRAEALLIAHWYNTRSLRAAA